MCEPAKTIIQICGGYEATARLARRSEGRVRRWEYPRERGGAGGLIPADCQQVLLIEARKVGIDLRPDHFFPDLADQSHLSSIPTESASGPDTAPVNCCEKGNNVSPPAEKGGSHVV